MSEIQWTDETWNPATGCTKVSPGCANCYIERTPPMRMAGRKFVNGKIPLELHLDRLDKPLRWKKPRRVFVNSMSDLFHEDVPDEFLDLVFVTMAMSPTHTFQILTKRHERMRDYIQSRDLGRIFETEHKEWGSARVGTEPSAIQIKVSIHNLLSAHGKRTDPEWPLPNVWLGVSVEDQKRADERIPLLLQTPAAVRFLSCEPLLGPINLERLNDGKNGWTDCLGGVWGHGFSSDHEGDGTEDIPDGTTGDGIIHWVIVGGESGNGARQAHLEWFRDIIKQCKEASVPVFMKQTGQCVLTGRTSINGPSVATQAVMLKDKKGGDPLEWPSDLRVREFPGAMPNSRQFSTTSLRTWN